MIDTLFETGFPSPVEKDGHENSTMICLALPDDLASALAVDGGEEASELHVTVLYLGKNLTEEQLEAVNTVVEGATSEYAPLDGTIDGAGRFPASPSSDEKDVLIRLVNMPRLEALREALIAGLRARGVEPKLNHGYTPHITLAYVDRDFEGVCRSPDRVPLKAESLWVATGGVWEEFPFTGSEVVKGGLLDDLYSRVPTAKAGASSPARFDADIVKVSPERQMVFGWVTVAEAGGEEVVDKQGDMISEDEMEKMAYDFVLNCRLGGEMHKRVEGIGRLVESMVFTKEKQQALGVDLGKSAWWCGFKVDDSGVWDKVKKGVYKAFSIHGKGVRQKVDD